MRVTLPSWRSPGYVAGGLPVAVTTDLIKAHLYLHAVLPQLEEVVRVDPAAQQAVAGWRGSIGLRVAGGPGLRLEVASGGLRAVRRGRGLPSLGLLLLGPGAAVRMFEGGGAAPLPWIGAWRPRLIGGLRALSARLQYYLRSDREQLQADGTFAAAVAIRLAVLVYAIGVLAEAWDEGPPHRGVGRSRRGRGDRHRRPSATADHKRQGRVPGHARRAVAGQCDRGVCRSRHRLRGLVRRAGAVDGAGYRGGTAARPATAAGSDPPAHVPRGQVPVSKQLQRIGALISSAARVVSRVGRSP